MDVLSPHKLCRARTCPQDLVSPLMEMAGSIAKRAPKNQKALPTLRFRPCT